MNVFEQFLKALLYNLRYIATGFAFADSGKRVLKLKIGKQKHGTFEPCYAASEPHPPYFQSNFHVGPPPFLGK